MKYLKRFNSVFEGLILEKAVVCSDKLVKILKTMESPLAKALLKAHEEGADAVDNSYIDYDQEDGLVSYLPANREINRETGQEIADKWNARGRQKISIGRLVRAMIMKLGINYPEAEIERFVNEYKAKQKPTRFVFAKTEADIKKYYFEGNYDRESAVGDCSLLNSCMRGANSQGFFSIYYHNESPCKLLVLLNNENDKVMGRAVIWEDVIDANNNTSFTFMDRIYTIDAALEEKFKSYARESGWWYKDRQSNQNFTITDGRDSENTPLLKVAVPNIDNRTQMPYMDTFATFGYEYIDGNFKAFLYNDVFKDRGGLNNWVMKFRSQYGGNEYNHYYNRKKDIFGNRVINPNARVLKEYEDYVWMIDDENDDLLNSNNFEDVYILFEKNGRGGVGDAVVALGIDNNEGDEDNGLCVVETAIYNGRYNDYISFSSEIADIIEQQNNLIHYHDWDEISNFKIPEHVRSAKALDVLLYHTHSYWIDNHVTIDKATSKECAEVILKYKPDILKEHNITNLLGLMKYELIDKNTINDRIKECEVMDLTYVDDSLWVLFGEYNDLYFMFDDNDNVRGRSSSREYAKEILNGDWDYGYADYSLNDVDFSIIDKDNREKILTIMEAEIDVVKSWFEEKDFEWSDNWKDKFLEDASGKLIWRCVKDNYDSIGDAIRWAMNSAQENADMSEAWEKVTDSIDSVTTIVMNKEGGPRFKFKNEWIVAVQNDDKRIIHAVERFFDYWEDYGVNEPDFAKVEIPYHGWQGDISNNHFNEELEYRLSEIM